MDDLAMTYRDFVNTLKMLLYVLKTPCFRANHSLTKKGNRYMANYMTLLSAEQFSADFDI